MAYNPYDQVSYRTFPRRQTHPNRLAAVARLFGLQTAPVARCRVLELGCGTGGNLIPLAYHLPQSHFIGVDLAPQPIDIARRMADTLELRNLDLRALDLRELTAAEGEFDYIFAHGLYSWIPPDVRDALLAVCRDRLTPNGVAFVSYNAYPGRYPRQMLREILLRHTREIEDPARQIAAARALLSQLPGEEAASLLEQGDDILFHDDLAPVNDAVWFHDFATHAARHGLQYLGEADPHDMFDPRPIPGGDVLDREQHLDFLKLRRFRQTLLCRSEIQLTRDVDARRMDDFLFSDNPHGHRIPGDDAAVEAVTQALRDTSPLPVEFAELIPYAGTREALREILFVLMIAGCVDLHVYDFPCEEEVTERPRASRLARYQAAAGGNVTNACHIPVELDELARRLVILLDGTRTASAIARDLAAAPGAPPLKQIRQYLPGSLDWLARMALLEG
ncbi:MAG: Methyltransferase type 12 [Candidatus Solibacter sp.]|nr:Methyltransferase type 12 [Candidatus Solibacter sp.]